MKIKKRRKKFKGVSKNILLAPKFPFVVVAIDKYFSFVFENLKLEIENLQLLRSNKCVDTLVVHALNVAHSSLEVSTLSVAKLTH